MDILEDDKIVLKQVFKIENSKKEYYYKIYEKETLEEIGLCGLRLGENSDNYYLGNIEYEIYENYRGHNYAKRASLLLSNLAVSNNVEHLYVTANPNNIASIKTILSLGAKFIEVTKIPKKSRLYKQGERVVSIYDWNIKERNDLNVRY